MLVDLYQDLICPWCLIGRKRFATAMAGRDGLTVTIRPRPFQLNPAMPRAGMDRQTYLAAKFGGPDRAARIYGIIEDTARREGLALELNRIARTPNTLAGHALVEFLVRTGGDALGLSQRLLEGYFFDLVDIGDIGVLTELTSPFGLTARETHRIAGDPECVGAVKAADARARQIGIQAVPSFVFDGRYAVSGAQEAEAFAPLLDLASVEADLETASS